MKLGHMLLLILLVSVLLVQGLKNPDGVATIFKASSASAVDVTKVLQGR